MRSTPSNAESIVSLQDVAVFYDAPRPILEGVSFSLGWGSFHFVVGPSGAGKTTLLKLIYLALRPTRGRLSVLGADAAVTPRRDLSALRRQMGIIFQDYRLLDHLSVFDNVALPLRIRRRPGADVRRDVTDLLGWAGLGSLVDRHPVSLSAGQKQLVAVARAVVGRPRLMLADEPIANVDDRTAMRLMLLFEELNRHGTTVLVATQNPRLVSRIDAGVLHLDRGHVRIGDSGSVRGSPPRVAEKESPAGPQ